MAVSDLNKAEYVLTAALQYRCSLPVYPVFKHLIAHDEEPQPLHSDEIALDVGFCGDHMKRRMLRRSMLYQCVCGTEQSFHRYP